MEGAHHYSQLREHLAYPEGGRENRNVTIACIKINRRRQKIIKMHWPRGEQSSE